MKPASKLYLLPALMFFLATGEIAASTSADLFKAVPAGDATYVKLQTLELAGLIPAGAADKTLTRYEVADLILNAQKNYKAIVVADANMTPSVPASTSPSVSDAMPSAAAADSAEDYSTPPPPSESVMNSDPAAAAATPPPVAPTPKPTPNYALHPELLVNAEAALKSLDEAYELELLAVMQAKGVMLDDLNKAEADQYQLWRDVKSVTESPSVAIHGVGRMFGVSENVYGNFSLTGRALTITGGKATTVSTGPVYITNPESQYMNGYLDLNLTGTITKQLQWDSILRLGTSALPLTGTFQGNNSFDTVNNTNYDTMNFRWISLHFSPDFMQADLGDFYESYTPLTLWNRNNLDVYYKPEPMARQDDQYKYESFFNHEPDWPFRGIRLGTALGWPDSNFLDRFKVSGFIHMIRNGFNDWPNFGWLFPADSPAGLENADNTVRHTNMSTDFIYAGHAELDLKKWYMGDLSVQFSGNAYVVILDQLYNPNEQVEELYYPLPFTGFGSAQPVIEYSYNKFDPNTWAHQYRISSFKPEIKIGFGGDVYLGAQYEGSFAEYQDDKTNQARTVSDFAVFANPYLQFDDSKITFDVVNVGPNYYSPLAQARQDYISLLSSGNSTTVMPGASVFSAPLRGQYFLLDQRTNQVAGASSPSLVDFIGVPRANAIYSYYDRTQDNVFPYGLATPNRQGIGFDFDLKSMPDKNFKLPGAVYFLNEISGNLVVNSAGNAFTVVDANNGVAPNRSFVYVNVGPSYDFGPALQLKTPFEFGTNVRYEQTNSQVGTLTDFWWLSGLKVGLFPWWEMTAAVGLKSAKGSDMGVAGTTLARYSYMYNNQDLGSYSVFTVDDSVNDLMLSTTFNMDSHSKLHFDYSFETGTNNGSSNGSTTTSGVAPGYVFNGSVNNQYVETTYEIEF